eukprot:152921_1
MIKLKDPFYTGYEMPHPIYYFDKEMKECLLFTPNANDLNHIMKYYFETDEYIELTEYPNNNIYKESISAHNHIIRNNTLTIFVTNDEKNYEIDLNLNNKNETWKCASYNTNNDSYFTLKSIVLLPNGDMHGISHGEHFKYNTVENNWDNLHNSEDISYMEFNHFNNTLYCFGRDKMQWNECKLSLPITASFGVLNACRCVFVMAGKILILFDFKSELMYFLDIYRNETEWIEKQFYKQVIKEHWQCLFVIVTKYNFIHFINTYPKHTICHYKTSLYHLLPDILFK